MLDIKWIIDNPLVLDQNLQKRQMPAQACKILEFDQHYRKILTQIQQKQQERNTIANLIGQSSNKNENLNILSSKAKNIKKQINVLEEELQNAKVKLDNIINFLPNNLLPEVPIGKNEDDNVIIKQWGLPKNIGNKRHFEIGEALCLMDFNTATKISGSRFVILKGLLAKLERALANFMLDIHTQKFGYEEVMLPILVKSDAMFGAGLLPKFANDSFKTTTDYWLIPTAEVPLVNMVAHQTIDVGNLPLKYVAYTPCFRSEAGASGKDTRGLIRQHQFAKVELVNITTAGQAAQEHENITKCAEYILEQLELPYRRMLLCSGDLGSHSAKTYDLNVWLPSENKYREISSCSYCTDYQTRRMQAKTKINNKTELLHTLNGSGLATGRTIAAILENYQQPDGSVAIPEVLKPYMNGLNYIKR